MLVWKPGRYTRKNEKKKNSKAIFQNQINIINPKMFFKIKLELENQSYFSGNS